MHFCKNLRPSLNHFCHIIRVPFEAEKYEPGTLFLKLGTGGNREHNF